MLGHCMYGAHGRQTPDTPLWAAHSCLVSPASTLCWPLTSVPPAPATHPPTADLHLYTQWDNHAGRPWRLLGLILMSSSAMWMLLVALTVQVVTRWNVALLLLTAAQTVSLGHRLHPNSSAMQHDSFF